VKVAPRVRVTQSTTLVSYMLDQKHALSKRHQAKLREAIDGISISPELLVVPFETVRAAMKHNGKTSRTIESIVNTLPADIWLEADNVSTD